MSGMLIGQPLPNEPGRGRTGRGNREGPPEVQQRRGLAGETRFPPRERAEGERRSRKKRSRTREELLARVELGPFDHGVEQRVERAAELRPLRVAEVDQIRSVDHEIRQAMRLRALFLEE